MLRTILVCGATGKQGGAVVKELLRQKAKVQILAATRNATSPSAQRLAQMSSNIKLVQGDMGNSHALLKTAREVAGGPVWGVFSVQVPASSGRSGGGEVGQGKSLVDAAVEAGVEHFVYTSVDRGSDSDNNPTDIPHFIAKHEIEKHLIAKTKETAMNWTILRPVAFMDNLTDDFIGRVFPTAFKLSVKDKPLKLVAVSDVGVFGARALLSPEQYKGQALSLAGDELTFDQFRKQFETTTGRELPMAYEIATRPLLWTVKELGYMFRWFYNEGFGANIEESRREHPELKSFEQWLKTESQFAPK